MILSIDPGLSGAIAALTDDGDLIAVVDMPTVEIERGGRMKRQVSGAGLAMLITSMTRHEATTAIVEAVGAMPGQGVTSVFSFGRSFGVVEGVLAGLQIPTVYAQPATWPRALKLGKGKGERRDLAMRTWPGKAEWFARVMDDGRADAALIGLWHAHTTRRAA